MFKIKFNSLLVFFIMLVIIALYYCRFVYDWHQKEQEYYLVMQKVKATSFDLLQKDLSKILNLYPVFESSKDGIYWDKEKLLLNLIKNFSIKNDYNAIQRKNFELEISPDTLKISKGKTISYIDLASLKALLSGMIPEYICYNIYLNNQLILNNEEFSSYLKITQTTSLPVLNNLLIELSINSRFLAKEKRRLLILEAIDYIAIIIPCILICLFLYRKINYKLSKEFSLLQEDFRTSTKYNELLHDKLKQDKEYSLMMISKINSQAKNKLLVKLTGEEEESELNQNFITFPVAIVDNTKNVINIKKLLENLTLFFRYDLSKKNIVLNVSSTVDNIEANASEESLYQIIFSLIFNVLNLIPDNTKLSMSVTNKDGFELSLQYTGFNLSEEQMRNYASRYPKEIFLLNLNQVFDHLKFYNFSYSIKKDPKNSMITLQITTNSNSEQEGLKQNKNKIFKLKDYTKK